MTEKAKIPVTGLDEIPGHVVAESLGLVFGQCRVEGDDSPVIMDGDRSWPWKETEQHYANLFRIAESHLLSEAERMGADAVVRVQMDLRRDHLDRPCLALVGTAVKLAVAPAPVSKASRAKSVGLPPISIEIDDPGIPSGDINIAFGEHSEKWRPVEAVQGPGSRGRGARKPTPRIDEGALRTMADVLDISIEKAKALFEAGFRSVPELARARPADLVRACSMNPTQARLLIERAKTAEDEEDEG